MKSEEQLRELIQERRDGIKENLNLLLDEELSEDELILLEAEIDYHSIMLYAFRVVLEDFE